MVPLLSGCSGGQEGAEEEVLAWEPYVTKALSELQGEKLHSTTQRGGWEGDISEKYLHRSRERNCE